VSNCAVYLSIIRFGPTLSSKVGLTTSGVK
jgi:hypothetical protein